MKMEEKKTGKGQSVLIIILILIILGLAGFIVYDKALKNNDSIVEGNANNFNEKLEVETPTSISVESDIVKTAMESFENIVLKDENLYKTGGYNISDISNYELLETAISNVDKKYVTYCAESSKKNGASIDELNNVISKFILDKKLEIADIKKIVNNNRYVGGWALDVSGNTVKIAGSCGGIFEPEDYQARKVVSAETLGDYLYIYEKNAFARYVEESNELVSYYKDYTKTNIVEKNIQSIYISLPGQNSPIEPNWDLYDTYKYTFKKVDGVYYFQNFELNK